MESLSKMSNSAWDEKVVIKGAGLAEGQYAVTLKDIVREDKVIQFREGLRSNSKGIVGKEYAALTAATNWPPTHIAAAVSNPEPFTLGIICSSSQLSGNAIVCSVKHCLSSPVFLIM